MTTTPTADTVESVTQADFVRYATTHGLAFIDTTWGPPVRNVIAALDAPSAPPGDPDTRTKAQAIMDCVNTTGEPRRPCRKRSFGLERQTERGAWARIDIKGTKVYRHTSGLWLVHIPNDLPGHDPYPGTAVYG